jgi:hypothetical protein
MNAIRDLAGRIANGGRDQHSPVSFQLLKQRHRGVCVWVEALESVPRGIAARSVALYLNRRLRLQGVHDLNTVNYCT